jgi:hypothetical protein
VLLDRAFGFAAVIAALAVELTALLHERGIARWYVDAAAMGTMLLISVAGIVVRNSVADLQHREIARVYHAVRQGPPDRPAAGRPPSPWSALAGLLRAVLEQVWNAVVRRDALAQWAYDMTRVLAARREKILALAAGMEEDARRISAATAASQRGERELAEQFTRLRALTEDAGGNTAALAERTQTLADAVRAVTAQVAHAATIAARLSEGAFALQNGVAAISGAAAAVSQSAGQVQSVFEKAETGARQAAPGDASAVRSLAQAGGAALQPMLASLATLQEGAGDLSQRLHLLMAAVEAQSDVGQALTHAAMLQADAVRRLLAQLAASQDEAVSLRQRVAGFAPPEGRLANNVPAQEAVERLPDYALAMAQLLRGLPEFAVAKPRAAQPSQPQPSQPPSRVPN